mgnify:CR=1 FL=1
MFKYIKAVILLLAVIGIIFSFEGCAYPPEEMLQIAGKKASKYPENFIEFTRADALSLPFPENSFACATTV